MNFLKSKIKFSIIIATYNSMKVLPKVVDSIFSQEIDVNDYEIIAVDGGSKDETINFLKRKGIKILNNPKKDPVNAKYLGLLQAQGKYVVYLDHDEVINNKNFLENRKDIFETDTKIKVIVPSGYVNPKGIHPINNYINEFGDPFSFFVYNISKHENFFINSLKKYYKVINESLKYVNFFVNLEKYSPLIEIIAGASCFDREYVLKKFLNSKLKPEFLTHLFFEICREYPYLVITKNDTISHYSSDSFLTYLNKIKWRVINNIFLKDQLGESGFSGREKYHNNLLLKLKKYLFIPYSLSFIFPLIDSFVLVISRKNLVWFIHLPLVVFTSFEIITNLLKKMVGIKPVLKTYDGKDKV